MPEAWLDPAARSVGGKSVSPIWRTTWSTGMPSR
jgi:hypothetical protein